MYTDQFAEWWKTNKNLNLPFAEWTKLSTEICRDIAEKNLEIIEENFSLASEQMKRLSNVRGLEDFMLLQKECLNEDVNAMLKNTQTLMQTMTANMEKLMQLWGMSGRTGFTAKPSERNEKVSSR